MTEGSPAIDPAPRPAHRHRRIWAIAGPAIVANSSAPLVGLVDTWVVGHLPGARYLAAVSVGAMVFSYLYWAFGFLRMSTTGLVAQADGRDDDGQIARTLVRSLILAALIGALILLGQNQLEAFALHFLAPPADTVSLFRDYFDIRIYAVPAALITYGINGYLIGTAQTKKTLYVQLVLNIANGCLNLFFVLGLKMGVPGVALGSLIAEWLAVGVGAVFILRGIGAHALLAAVRDPETIALAKMKKLLSTNVYIFVRTLLLILVFALITRNAAQLGEVPLAASHVLQTFLMLIALGLDGFAYAAEALTGAAYGKGVRHEFRAWVMDSMAWAGAAAVLYSLGFWLFGGELIRTLTDIESVRTAALSALPVIVALPVLSVWAYQFDGIYIGATAGAAMLGTAAIAAASFVLAVGPLTNQYGLPGLWSAVTVFMVMRGLSQALWYPRLERALEN
ncbi:MATE family efflux transporter [Kordiimonas marina]|uniref:MATE family efflux transporter n=1 Tax=Kordiimonas marina TaxID=2872312 RepID=UPI001FF2F028|nr:MATE family efflux transporter [Kordiimonas marina]MCJ9429899.1 MATE family efflux transporter [Kordiimonas marina]